MIEIARGNLLEANAQALVNTVNTQGVMGKGIALQFKRAFPENFAAYEREAKAGRIEVGKLFVHAESGVVGPRFIVNFPTKKHWRNPSRLEWIDAGLAALATEIRSRNIASVAVPPLGCGNGGLAWADVLPRIEKTLGELPGVRVLVYPPEGAPLPAAMPDRTKRPALTQKRAAVIELCNQYMVAGFEDSLTMLELQKVTYFLQAAGEDLNLRYEANRYGPYADKLRKVLERLEGHYLSGYGDGTASPEAVVSVLPGALDAARASLTGATEVSTRIERVKALIEGFETPLGMELLATVHWVAHRDELPARAASEALAAVQQWSTRKAKLMNKEAVQAAWDRLAEQGWLPAVN